VSGGAGPAANPDGGWGYHLGGPSRPEPTLLAGLTGPLPVAFLAAHPPGWWTLLLPAVSAGRAPALEARAMDHLARARSAPVAGDPGFDPTLPGWGWVPGTAAWVEPTAFALLSLRRAGGSAALQGEAVALLEDRVCRGGGWNYGNPLAFDRALPPQPGPTAWAALALPPGHPAAPPALRSLADGPLPGPGVLPVGVLAARAQGGALPAWDSALRAAPLPARNDHQHLHLAALARLDGAPCPLTGAA